MMSLPKYYLAGYCFLISIVNLPINMAFAQTAPPLPAVTFSTIENRPASQPLNYLGRIEAIHFVDVQTRTEGFIKKIHFTEGQMVNAGDLLFEIEPDVHLSVIDQSKAQVSSAQAALTLAEVMYARMQNLLRNRAVSQSEADRARADRDVALAALNQAEAALRSNELQLSFTRILAPISGRIGHTRFDVGSYINMASGALVNIAQLDPIRVVISIRERDFISATLQDAQLHLDLLGKDFAPQLRLANGKIYPTRGVLDSINNQIDAQTGTIEIRARFENPLHVLMPGGVVDVTLDAQEPALVPTVPITALQQDQNGHFVLMLDDKNTVVVQPVKIGGQIDQYFIVEQGLKVGDRVIIEGLQRARPGITVNPIPALQQ